MVNNLPKKRGRPAKKTLYENFIMFDYIGSSYNEFAKYLQKTLTELMNQSNYGIVPKSLVVIGMGIPNFARWRHLITKDNVVDGNHKLWLMEFILAGQERRFLQVVTTMGLDQLTRNALIQTMGAYYGQTYHHERHTLDDAKVEGFKEKFTITLEGTGTLND